MRARSILFGSFVVACNHDPHGLGGNSFGSGQSGGDEAEASSDGDESGGGDTSGAGEEDTAPAESDGGDTAPSDTTGGDPSGGSSATTDPSSGSAGDTGSGDEVGECSNFTSVMQFHTYLNTERNQYGTGFMPHQRYKGYPWQGEGHDMFTFSIPFNWDDGLAASAQAEAESLAAGAAPTGHQQNGSNGLPFCPAAPFWIDGINTSAWKISFAEHETDWMPPPDHVDSCPAPFALSADNQHARMGLFYHDFGGDGPAINKVGVGAAVGEDCEVWWVLQFGP
jgi:hypothetical protein